MQPKQVDKKCTISFQNNKDLDKALEHVMYESGQGFTMINERTISISKSQCDMLESYKEKENIKYRHLK
jgi:hypothetical protein